MPRMAMHSFKKSYSHPGTQCHTQYDALHLNPHHDPATQNAAGLHHHNTLQVPINTLVNNSKMVAIKLTTGTANPNFNLS